MTNISKINMMKDAYVVILDGDLNLFSSIDSAESFLKKEMDEELENMYAEGYITLNERNDIKRFHGEKYMKLTDYVNGLNELEAKMLLMCELVEDIKHER